ncbi:MAG: MBOAT family protein [Bacteroidia bacterium]|nr:MBOAT family protein [Bacteroidia bacterium]MCX7651561.1 MBOAT family protein [Bacteroidia bacterium]MDW8417263.1 MBOAT family protein [Bacteroidia bacterium]
MPLDWQAIWRSLFLYQENEPMLFPTLTFWVWAIVVFGFYGVAMQLHRRRWGLLWLLVFSVFFYYKSAGGFVIIFLGLLVLEYLLVLWMKSSRKPSQLAFWSAIIIPLGFLGYYKYTLFFIQNWNYLTGSRIEAPDIFLPAGISFYTFQMISYVVDVRRNRISPSSFWDYALYIAYFPQLVAGPIVRAEHFLPQLSNPLIDSEQIGRGFWLVLQGLVKKVAFADYIAQYNDLIFANPKGYSGLENLFAIYGYALQIFYDFSGYSDVAIGIGRMMGFDLGVNFAKPYLSTSITEFWRRWHISLSSWLRDYLYIPLGGNRRGVVRTYVNLFLTMLIGGLWHGASWRFVVWGGVHGLALAVHRAIYGKDIPPRSVGRRLMGWFLTFHLVCALWVFFRASDFSKAVAVLSQVSTDTQISHLLPLIERRSLLVGLVLLGYILHTVPMIWVERVEKLFARSPFWVKVTAFIGVIQLILEMRQTYVQPFIYFQF